MDDTADITLHLAEVADVLRAETPADLPPAARARRLELLDVLEGYAWARSYPRHRGPVPEGGRRVAPPRAYVAPAAARPRFIDDGGVHCAVGYLISVDDPALALAVEAADPFGYVLELQVPALGEWAAAHGFTAEELAWIQPSYVRTMPSCDAVERAFPLDRTPSGCDGQDLRVVVPSDNGRVVGEPQFYDVCPIDCWARAVPAFVVNRGGAASAPTWLRAGAGAPMEVPALAPGASQFVRVSMGDDPWAGLTVDDAGGCGEVPGPALPYRFDMGVELDDDLDGFGAARCGGVDCDDADGLVGLPDCLDDGGTPVSRCDMPCEVYACNAENHINEDYYGLQYQVEECLAAEPEGCDGADCLVVDGGAEGCACGPPGAPRVGWFGAVALALGLRRRSRA